MLGTEPSGVHSFPWSVQRMSTSFATCVRSARFCLPHSIDSCRTGSPGSVSLDQRASRSRFARFAASCPAGLSISRRNSLRASATEFSEPATAIHTVVDPEPGTATL